MIRQLEQEKQTLRPPPGADGRFRFSRDDFDAMVSAGVLTRDDRVELIDGEIVAMTPIGPLHGGTTDRLNWYFSHMIGKDFICRVQGPVAVTAASELYPDFAILKYESSFYSTDHPQCASVLLVVEVSDSSLLKDRGPKLREYARAGIQEYWIVDLDHACVRVFREPSGDQYRLATEHRAGESIAPAAFPECALDLQWLLGP